MTARSCSKASTTKPIRFANVCYLVGGGHARDSFDVYRVALPFGEPCAIPPFKTRSSHPWALVDCSLQSTVLKGGMAPGSSKRKPGLFSFRNIADRCVGLHAHSDRDPVFLAPFLFSGQFQGGEEAFFADGFHRDAFGGDVEEFFSIFIEHVFVEFDAKTGFVRDGDRAIGIGQDGVSQQGVSFFGHPTGRLDGVFQRVAVAAGGVDVEIDDHAEALSLIHI